MPFKPRLAFASARDYVLAAARGELQPGQFVQFEGIKARFARADLHLITIIGACDNATFARACREGQQ